MFEYFYHEILRRTIIGFGTLFNNIIIKKTEQDGSVSSVIKVPLAYGPTQKFLARVEQAPPNLNNPVQVTLPRMSFEFNGLTYDNSRKLTTTQQFITTSVEDNTQIKKAYMPVPYNMSFELSIMTKINDDMLQIIEQILPYFQPAYTLTVDLVESIGEKRDIPIVLEGITMQDDYEGDYTSRRALIYTLKFTAKTYLFGPVISANDNIIRKVSIGYVAGDSRGGTRDLTYQVTPIATKSYSNNVVAFITDDINYTSTEIPVNSVGAIPIGSFITLNDETIKVISKDSQKNILTVERASYNTVQAEHVSGTELLLITEADNNLIEIGDDFGFSGGVF